MLDEVEQGGGEGKRDTGGFQCMDGGPWAMLHLLPRVNIIAERCQTELYIYACIHPIYV